MITRDEITAIVAECAALNSADVTVDYDTKIAFDSLSFVWLQHVLDERFGYDLQPPSSDVMPTLDSARSVHRYLAEISPDLVVAAD